MGKGCIVKKSGFGGFLALYRPDRGCWSNRDEGIAVNRIVHMDIGLCADNQRANPCEILA
tara:strand:- start:12371 stop:12550 length:180 start_codon:yes stop_codon:yes gene_type:complete